MTTATSFLNEDLVLRVRPDYDPAILRLDRYEGFLDALCRTREYQKEAIRTVCRLLGGGQYSTARDLAVENYARNPILADRYGSLAGLVAALPFPDKLSCSVDLATATGKSWVIYGIARILLAEGVVDRVLVLCPSLTIEAGLSAKFVSLSGDPVLHALIPADAMFRNPSITDANATTGPGDICIENIDATYKHVRSSVRDSFKGKGGSTLVLNDETHHVFSPPTGQAAVRRWKEFLEDPEFAFARVVGFSGTCYVGDAYFADVVSRYSLRTAIEDGRAKEVRYDVKDESLNQEERFQKYLELHRQNERMYRPLKPLSILVTGRVSGAQAVANEFIQFLAGETGSSVDEARQKVLVVTSSPDHAANVAQLPYVDRPENPVEWIFSVSMLTEGWDVQNVFQVIPHEKRAFNSKLLIAQVLGRGLRIPLGLTRPSVWVFNHANWSSEIADLVREVLEQERRLGCYPVDVNPRGQFHLELHSLTYKTTTTEQELSAADGQIQLFTKGYVEFETQPVELERTTVFAGAVDAREHLLKTRVHYAAYTVDEVVRRIRGRLKSIDLEAGTSYARAHTAKKLKIVIDASLARIGETRGVVSEQNLQHTFRAMGNVHRPAARTARIQRDPDQIVTISTHGMRSRSVALSAFAREATVFFDSASETISSDDDRRALEEIADVDSPYPKKATRTVDNFLRFKTPVNLVLTTHEPERRFVARLFEPAVADRLKAWVKSPDTGFYEIAFTWRRGDHTKQGTFNPDLFVRLAESDDILVVELKDDGDVTDENRAKLRHALAHFDLVNLLQSDASYHVKFLSPESYDAFFQAIQDGTATTFVSALQAQLAA